MKILAVLLFMTCGWIPCAKAQRTFSPANTIHIPGGSPINIDGRVEAEEWDHGAGLIIDIDKTWKVTVRLKHDAFLYFLLSGLKRNGERLFPEILIDPMNRRRNRWEKGQWWFHVSGNLCEGNGEPNVYEKDGVFQCAHQKQGWDGNNPLTSDGTITEIRISFSKLGIQAVHGRQFGIAFDLTNATGDDGQKWYFWPKAAQLDSPASWGYAFLE
jgi:hypothetical protein